MKLGKGSPNKYIPTKPLGWLTKVGLASSNAGENLDGLERGFDEFPCWLTKVWLGVSDLWDGKSAIVHQ